MVNKFMVDSPTKILIRVNKRDGKKKFFTLDINYYRNAHYTILNTAKQLYKDIMIPLLMKSDSHLIRMNKIEISYQLIAPNNRAFDIMNIIAIVDKFFQDVLVDMGIIQKDTWKFVRYIEALPIIIDKDLPEMICRIIVKESNK